ncbi:hypothetical protein M0R45_034929 [Rubus argutus]|uniref:TIR domain-containing protein n=1 Tax=Rubus argutus TaxID=59490 RepID=A0AAW1VW27_RUBAR
MDSLTTQQASLSLSSSTRSWTHDVFLSFRGHDSDDTLYNFTGHLHSYLVQKGINTFTADELPRGEEISQALVQAIEGSRISIIVFSENYASSKWCLDELVHILKCRRSKKQMVCPVFYKVDPSDIRHHRGSFGDALANHEHKFNCNMERVKKWRAALSEAANLSGWHFSGYESHFIQEIVDVISAQLKELTYLNVAKHPVGLDPRVQEMLQILDVGGSDILMVGIWGTSGIGKTTIAKAVYNKIAHKFEGSCFLANVREESEIHGGLVKLQKILLSQIVGGGEEFKVINVGEGITLLRERLRHKMILLVLDDVNKLYQLDKLAGATDWFGRGSRIIITTRDKHLLIAHQVSPIYKARELDPHEARELFSLNAFKNKTNFDDGEELSVSTVVEYAEGIPLALEVLGSHLCCIPIHQWQAEFIMHRSISRQLEGFKIFQNLTSINFESCQFLKEFRDISGLPNLRILNLDCCTSLVKIDDSVGFLEKLVDLSLSGCHNLIMFPRRIALKSVEHINIRGCRKLETLPEIVGEMESLTRLDLSGTGIKELPSSIGYFINLEELIMEECENLTNLPCCIYELQHLWCLDLQYCSKLVMLPRWNAESLPTKSTISPDLWYLNLRGCKRLQEIPELPPKVQWLNAADCVQLESFAVLSNILKHKESEMIKCLVLSNCQRLCDSLALDVAKIGRNILNEVSLCSLFLSCAQSEFEVVFPGNEIPRWFSHHKELNFLGTSKLSFEIPVSFKLRNKGLAICAAVAVGTTTPKEKNVMQSNLGNLTFTAKIDINGESTVARSFSFEAKDMALAHVWLCYIPFIVFAYRQLPPFTCGVRVEHTSQGSVRCKSYGVHIVIPQDEDEDVDSEGLEDEDIENNMK